MTILLSGVAGHDLTAAIVTVRTRTTMSRIAKQKERGNIVVAKRTTQTNGGIGSAETRMITKAKSDGGLVAGLRGIVESLSAGYHLS